MKSFGLTIFFAGTACAHSTVRAIKFDGTTYPPYDPRIDALLGDGLRRIEWSYRNSQTPMGPVTNVSAPDIACQWDATPPVLKAVARAGSDVSIEWTNIIRMHAGPIMTYLGHMPTPATKPTEIKFFKVHEQGYDPSTDKWANQDLLDHNGTFSFKIPSDITPGTYVLRTELLSLHGNMGGFLESYAVSGPQFYPHCFNVEIIGNGTTSPDGQTFPGGYNPKEIGLNFVPYTGSDSGVQQNSKYVMPGPKLYQGSFDAPNGPIPIVKETGAYSGEIAAKYDALRSRMDRTSDFIISLVNDNWKNNANVLEGVKGLGKALAPFGPALMDYLNILKDVMDFKKLLDAAQ